MATGWHQRVMTGIILMEMVSWLMVVNPSVCKWYFFNYDYRMILTDGIILMV